MVPQTYSDGVQKISIRGGVVRIDLVSYDAGDEPGDDNKPEIIHRVVMSPEGFLQTFGAMERVIGQLEDKGAIKRR